MCIPHKNGRERERQKKLPSKRNVTLRKLYLFEKCLKQVHCFEKLERFLLTAVTCYNICEAWAEKELLHRSFENNNNQHQRIQFLFRIFIFVWIHICVRIFLSFS